MGIERFFSSIQENKITNIESPFTKNLEKQIKTNHLYIDFNSIVYITSYKVTSQLNYILYCIIAGKTIGNSKFDEYMNLYKFKLEEINSPDKFAKKINIGYGNVVMVQKIQEYIVNILTNYVIPKELKNFYIAIDGVPSKSKMIEQKKRRYIGAIMRTIRKHIFEKHEKELMNDSVRYTYEKFKISFDTNAITPGTEFMDLLDQALKSDEFISTIKGVCPNIETYMFSGVYEPGEGEMKIVDHMLSLKNPKGSFVVYSPDSDVPLLILIVHTVFSENIEINILRHNSQRKAYDVVSVNKLAENIYQYVLKKIGTQIPDKNSVINDIVYLLTVFGNDFVPKIESYNVKYDFDKIINIYIGTLLKFKKDVGFDYLVQKSGTKKVLNQNFLVKTMGFLNKEGNIQKVYMEKNYQNYNRLKKIIGADNQNFVEVMYKFLEKLRSFIDEVRKKQLKEVVKKWSKDDVFIEKLKRLTHLGGRPNTKNEKFVELFYTFYERQKKIPRIEVGFRRYKRTLDDRFHRDKLEKTLENLDPGLRITPYDEEVFKFENMLDEYRDMFRADTLNLGYVKVDTKRYMWFGEKITKSIARYYHDFFGIKGELNMDNKDLTRVVEKYVEGIMWVFEHYFNHNSIKDNREVAQLWYYPYSKAPLFKQIYDFMKMKTDDPKYLEKLGKKVFSQSVPMEEFFNCLEHYMYTAPAPLNMHLVPKVYRDFVKNSGYYLDIEQAVKDMLKGDSTNLLDCRGAIFLSKCELKLLEHEDTFQENKKQLIEPLRKIKLDKDLTRRTGEITTKHTNVFTHNY